MIGRTMDIFVNKNLYYRNVAEKLAWALVISAAFSYAGYLIVSSINEAGDNPIVSSVEVVDGNLVKFPAVTVSTSPPYVHLMLLFKCNT